MYRTRINITHVSVQCVFDARGFTNDTQRTTLHVESQEQTVIDRLRSSSKDRTTVVVYTHHVQLYRENPRKKQQKMPE